MVALDNVSLNIRSVKSAVFLASGSGKSTLLHLIAGLRATRGTIKINGNRIEKMNERQLALFRQRFIVFCLSVV